MYKRLLLTALIAFSTSCSNTNSLVFPDIDNNSPQGGAPVSEYGNNSPQGGAPVSEYGNNLIQSQAVKSSTSSVNVKINKLVSNKVTYNNSEPTMHIDGVNAYPAMFRIIEDAKSSLYVETFIFHNDESGKKVAEKLVEKKKQGVDVKVLIDGLGLRIKKDSPIYDYLKTNGVDVRIYNKMIVGIHGINITHRKLIIADGETGVTGGMNFGVEYEKDWHDSMTEFQGQVVQDMQKEFFINWKKAGGEIPKNTPKLPKGKIYGNTPMRVTVTSAHEQDKRYQIKDSILTMIDNAKNRIIVEGAYFSDDDLINTLIGAAHRGVEVMIIMPIKGDSKIFDKLNMYTARKMLENKVRVFFYQPRFSHMKAAIIDDFTIVGSANPDARSFRENQELNVIVENENFKKDLENRLIHKDMYQSNVEDLKSVDVSAGKKVAQTVLELIDYYL